MENRTLIWHVTGIELTEKCIVLAGADPEAVLAALRSFGRNAMLNIGDMKHFLLIAADAPEEVSSEEITVFRRGDQLVVTRGLKGEMRTVLADFQPRDGVWEGKPAAFYENPPRENNH